MSKIGTVQFIGKSGTPYSFNAYTLPEECAAESGIYIFGSYDNIANNITPVYIGKAQSFQSRFYDHHKDTCIKTNGGNCICLMQVTDENKRTKIEEDLLKAYKTKCNEVLNPLTPK